MRWGRMRGAGREAWEGGSRWQVSRAANPAPIKAGGLRPGRWGQAAQHTAGPGPRQDRQPSQASPCHSAAPMRPHLAPAAGRAASCCCRGCPGPASGPPSGGRTGGSAGSHTPPPTCQAGLPAWPAPRTGSGPRTGADGARLTPGDSRQHTAGGPPAPPHTPRAGGRRSARPLGMCA